MTLDEVTTRMRVAVGADSGIGRSVRYDFGGEGRVVVDGGMVTNEDRTADLTITMSIADFTSLVAGKLDPTMAVMTGRMRVSDLGLAMALQGRMMALTQKAKNDLLF